MKNWWTTAKSIKVHYEKKAEKVEKSKATRVQSQQMSKCVVCGARFQCARYHAECCGSTCRQRRSRAAIAKKI